MAKLKSIALAVTGVSAVSGAAYSHAATSNQTGMAMMRLNSSLLDQVQKKTAGGSLWSAMRKNFQMAEVNSELVRRHESKFSAGRAYFDRTINRSKPYMYHIANEVKKRNMPAEIALLPFIESAFVTKAKSHVGASGLWQFMPATGRHFGLERTSIYDGRHDVYAATDAALNYLEYLHGMFGDWSLALAAYNWGEGNVSRAMKRARARGLEPVYENLKMPAETRNYVPKLLAVRNIVNNPNSFGMHLSEIENKPYFKAISVDKPMDTEAIARLANISESEFLALNPAFNAPVFVPKTNRKLLLPAHAVSIFEKNYRNTKPENLFSWQTYAANGKISLSRIAADAGMTVAELKGQYVPSTDVFNSTQNILVAKNNKATPDDSGFIHVAATNKKLPDSYKTNLTSLQEINSGSDHLNSSPITILAQQSKPVIKPEQNATSKSISIAAALIDQNQALINTGELNMANLESDIQIASNTIEAPELSADSIEVAITEPLPLPTQTSATPGPDQPTPSDNPVDVAITEINLTNRNNTSEPKDPLLALVNDAEQQRSDAAERVKNSLAQSEAEEAAAKSRAERIAANRVKQQQRTEARLARANEAAMQANNTHKVVTGDTLFNISQRYNVSVADLITVNNIKGNSIRKGQVLKVTAAAVQRNAVRNVSYTVRKGDTLNTIASRFNVDINDIRRWNRNTRTVKPGQRLRLIGS